MSQQKIILVVDDNPQLIDGVKLTLEMEGFQVLTATTGREALTVLERITPDLILADIMMPEVDGYQLYEAVHADERWVQVPFIFLTAKTNSADIRRGKEMGADDYITKPFAADDLVAAVRGRLKRAAELSGRPASTDVIGHIKYAWHGKLGPAPVPFVVLAAVV
ncbi:MAG: response regulator, partial [Anaerolineae bacterium]|nr:response regulator [Anaerolineae bacterium]